MTNGMKSTELWLSVLAVGIGIFLAMNEVEAVTIAAVVSPIVGYALSRGIAKNGKVPIKYSSQGGG